MSRFSFKIDASRQTITFTWTSFRINLHKLDVSSSVPHHSRQYVEALMSIRKWNMNDDRTEVLLVKKLKYAPSINFSYEDFLSQNRYESWFCHRIVVISWIAYRCSLQVHLLLKTHRISHSPLSFWHTYPQASLTYCLSHWLQDRQRCHHGPVPPSLSELLTPCHHIWSLLVWLCSTHQRRDSGQQRTSLKI